MRLTTIDRATGQPIHKDVGAWMSIDDLPTECIYDCARSGDCTADVEAWRRELNFEVERHDAITALLGYGAWDADELAEKDDDDLAEIVLWIACGDFREWMIAAEEAGVNPYNPPEDFSPNSGSSFFTLEG